MHHKLASARSGDLKGKLVALADETGTITISTRKLLALHGLREGDFRVKIIEGTPARFQCLVRGVLCPVAAEVFVVKRMPLDQPRNPRLRQPAKLRVA